jgi:8-oxo-dGTP diphosphatase
MSIQQVCVIYVTRSTPLGRQVLLGRKRTGLGAGKVVAPGGKLELGESATHAVLRELREEVGAQFRCSELDEVGINRYRFPTKPAWHQDSHVFTASWSAGEPEVSEELQPEWVDAAEVPYDEMWADARLWLPSVLGGGRCGAEYTFAADLSSLDATRPCLGADVE